jgi:hypothetical protein
MVLNRDCHLSRLCLQTIHATNMTATLSDRRADSSSSGVHAEAHASSKHAAADQNVRYWSRHAYHPMKPS